MLEGKGLQGRGGKRGEKRDNYNSIINRIYLNIKNKKLKTKMKTYISSLEIVHLLLPSPGTLFPQVPAQCILPPPSNTGSNIGPVPTSTPNSLFFILYYISSLSYHTLLFILISYCLYPAAGVKPPEGRDHVFYLQIHPKYLE